MECRWEWRLDEGDDEGERHRQRDGELQRRDEYRRCAGGESDGGRPGDQREPRRGDRERGVEGKSEDLGGRRIVKKKKESGGGGEGGGHKKNEREHGGRR